MRRLRISTWLLAAIFLAALALFILFRPTPASSENQPGKTGSTSPPTTTVPGMPFPGVIPSSSPDPSPTTSPTSG
jgi:hypothetical protein